MYLEEFEFKLVILYRIPPKEMSGHMFVTIKARGKMCKPNIDLVKNIFTYNVINNSQPEPPLNHL